MDAPVYVTNCWYVAAWSTQVPVGQMLAIPIAGQPLLLYRADSVGLVALEDRCCHRAAPLSKGRIEDDCNVRCMYHGFKFAPTGECIEIPGEARIPRAARVRKFPVAERHSWIWVWMGDPHMADEKLIPPAVGLDQHDYVLGSGQIDYAADYQLINDNLTDFSHLSYVHANSFGTSDHWAATRPNIERLERGIRVSRWMPARDAFRGDAPGLKVGAGDEAPAALYQTYDFLVPGILLMYTATVPQRAVPEDLRLPPRGDVLTANFTSQAVTPMDEQTSRYFFSWGPRAKDGGMEMAEGMMAVALKAFGEDKEIIEAQQRTLNRATTRQILTSADEGPILMRRVIRDLAELERQALGTAEAVAG